METLSELLKWTMSEWDAFGKLPTMAKLLIRQELADVKSSRTEQNKTSVQSPSEKIANIHKVKRYFYWFLDLGIEQLPMLDKEAVQRTFEEMAQTYEGSSLLNEIKGFFGAYTLVKTKNIKINRGVLLHGPPGTGKTDITSSVTRKIGLTEVVYVRRSFSY